MLSQTFDQSNAFIVLISTLSLLKRSFSCKTKSICKEMQDVFRIVKFLIISVTGGFVHGKSPKCSENKRQRINLISNWKIKF